jgi:hypothetical protein
MRAEVRITAGASYTGTLRLLNEGSAVHARAELLDFRLDAEQVPQFETQIPEESAYSCRRWLTVNPMETDLPEGGQKQVRYTIRVPASAEPRSYHCAVGFTSMPPAGESAPMGLRTAVRVVAALYVIVGEPPVEGRLSGISMEPVPGTKALRAVLTVENTGKMYFRPNGSVTVLDPRGNVLETHEITPVPVLPERKQRLLVPLGIAEGQPGAIRVRVDLGTGEIQEGIVTIKSASAQP